MLHLIKAIFGNNGANFNWLKQDDIWICFHYIAQYLIKNYSVTGFGYLLLITGIISISFSYLPLYYYVSNLGPVLRLSKKLSAVR
jgi:hypothetical protein